MIAAEAFDVDYKTGRRHTDYSVTQLIKDPLPIQIVRRYGDKIKVDVRKRLWALFGSAIHLLLEKVTDLKKFKREERFFLEIDGKIISGQADLYEKKPMILSDYKTTSVFKIKKGIKNKDWIQQLNMLAYLAEKSGTPVKELKIVAFAKDWRKGESDKAAKEGKPYPDTLSTISIPKHPGVKVLRYIKERVKLHADAEGKELKDIPKCKDTWGGRMCKDYCDGNSYCPYYQEYLKNRSNK